MKLNAVSLCDAGHLEMSPIVWKPGSYEEKFAAIVGYITGDGTINEKEARYVRKDGSTSGVLHLNGAIYSNHLTDIEEIMMDCKSVSLGVNVKVCVKKNTGMHIDGYQIQISNADCQRLVDYDTPVGKKVYQEFLVPKWIMNSSAGVKRAYIGALFGAEGSTPSKDKGAKSRLPRLPVMSMHKRGDNCGLEYFNQLRQILKELGVESSVTVTGKDSKAHTLRVLSGRNLINFFDNVGYVYCNEKSKLAWLWSKYLKAYFYEVDRRRLIVLDGVKFKTPHKEIAEKLNISVKNSVALRSSIVADEKGNTAGHSFPHFEKWIEERWCNSTKILKIKINEKSVRTEKSETWNILVSSHDHSYLLESGVNNFNSFLSMSGRVYYGFDRKRNVRDKLEFNPQLPIYIGQDFNIDPMSSAIMQIQPNGEVWIVDEIVLYGSNTSEVCDEIERRYWRHKNQITIYPDPAGGSRQHARGETDLDVFREKGFRRIKYRRKHPLVSDRINCVNRLILSASGESKLFVDKKCKHSINAFEQVIYKEGTREVDKSLGVEHISDGIGYFAELEFPTRKIEIKGISL